MRALRWLGLVAVGCGTVEEPPAPAPDPLGSAHELALAVGERVRDQLDCEASMVRYLCPAASLPGHPVEPSALRGAWMGLTVAMRNSHTVEANALETAAVSVLRAGEDGVSLVSLRPSDDEEVAELTSLASNLSLVLKARTDRVYISAGLSEYLRNAPLESSELRSDAHGLGFVASHPARIYKVAGRPPGPDAEGKGGHPAAWVVVEQGAGGAFLSVFPDVSLSDAPARAEEGPPSSGGRPAAGPEAED